MNSFLILSCCLVSLVSARPDVSLGYRYRPGYDSGSSLLSAPVTASSYTAAPSGSGSSVNFGGFDSGAASGSVDFLSPGYNVGSIRSGGSSSYSGGVSSGSVGLSSQGFGVGSGSLGYSSGGSGGSGYSSGGSGGLGYSSGGNGGLGLSSSNFGYSSSSLGLGGGSSGLSGSNSGFSSIGLGGGYDGGVNQGQFGVSQQYAASFAHQAPIITKNFYIHSAPEDHDDQQIVRYITIGRPLKNYRVVFINVPSSTSTKAKIIANVAPVEDKTAIYVLSKKTNELDISAEVVTPAPTGPSKPDVFFIKYKTPQEAIHAQHVIQAQYDQLGGSSSLSDEGFAPVQSVIGHLGDSGAAGVSGGAIGNGFGGSLSGGSLGGGSLHSGSLVGSSLGGGSVGSSSLGGSSLGFGGSSGGSFGSSHSGSFGAPIGGGNFQTTSTFVSQGSGSDASNVGILGDQSQISQVSGGKLTSQPNYLPPTKYRRY